MEIKFSDIFFLSAWCTCPNCKEQTAIDSEKISKGVTQCYHCDKHIKINIKEIVS